MEEWNLWAYGSGRTVVFLTISCLTGKQMAHIEHHSHHVSWRLQKNYCPITINARGVSDPPKLLDRTMVIGNSFPSLSILAVLVCFDESAWSEDD